MNGYRMWYCLDCQRFVHMLPGDNGGRLCGKCGKPMLAINKAVWMAGDIPYSNDIEVVEASDMIVTFNDYTATVQHRIARLEQLAETLKVLEEQADSASALDCGKAGWLNRIAIDRHLGEIRAYIGYAQPFLK